MVDNSRAFCQATRRDGEPCSAKATIGDHCLGHAPDLEEKRQEARREGGRNKATSRRSEKLLPGRLRPVASLLETSIKEVHDGTLDPKAASAMASLAGALSRTVSAGEVVRGDGNRNLATRVDQRKRGCRRSMNARTASLCSGVS